MPRLDGLEATRMFRAAGIDVPILVLTQSRNVEQQRPPAMTWFIKDCRYCRYHL